MAGVMLGLAGQGLAPAAAQSNSQLPATIPGLGNYSLPPSSRFTPVPVPTATSVATPTAPPGPSPTSRSPAAPAPVPSAPLTPRVRPSSTPSAVSTPTPSAALPSPLSTGAAAPTAVPAPVAQPTPDATPPAAGRPSAAGQGAGTSGAGTGWAAAGLALLALVLAGGWFLRRRRIDDVAALDEELGPDLPIAPPPDDGTAPHVARRTPDQPEPRIELILSPRRAGTNLTGAAVEYHVIVRNTGEVTARDVRFTLYLLTASARQQAELQQAFATPVAKPAVAPFELDPGAEMQVAGMAMLAREALNVMTIEGRPWFVPVLAMKADYRWGDNVGVPGIATAAYVIGIDRGEGAKMAPFRLDTGPRMYSQVAQRRVA